MHTLFWGINKDCYGKRGLFIEFCLFSSAFAARVESEQKKKGQNSQLQETRNPGKNPKILKSSVLVQN